MYPQALSELEELFRAFDDDNSGELSDVEVKNLLMTMGLNLDDKVCMFVCM
jgi:Ca2+-binding EF-hand superfamily protein